MKAKSSKQNVEPAIIAGTIPRMSFICPHPFSEAQAILSRGPWHPEISSPTRGPSILLPIVAPDKNRKGTMSRGSVRAFRNGLWMGWSTVLRIGRGCDATVVYVVAEGVEEYRTRKTKRDALRGNGVRHHLFTKESILT